MTSHQRADDVSADDETKRLRHGMVANGTWAAVEFLRRIAASMNGSAAYSNDQWPLHPESPACFRRCVDRGDRVINRG